MIRLPSKGRMPTNPKTYKILVLVCETYVLVPIRLLPNYPSRYTLNRQFKRNKKRCFNILSQSLPSHASVFLHWFVFYPSLTPTFLQDPFLLLTSFALESDSSCRVHQGLITSRPGALTAPLSAPEERLSLRVRRFQDLTTRQRTISSTRWYSRLYNTTQEYGSHLYLKISRPKIVSCREVNSQSPALKELSDFYFWSDVFAIIKRHVFMLALSCRS